MSRFDPGKLYIIQMLHTSSSHEQPVSARQIADYLTARNIRCDEDYVVRETTLLQSYGLPILCSENSSRCFYIEK